MYTSILPHYVKTSTSLNIFEKWRTLSTTMKKSLKLKLKTYSKHNSASRFNDPELLIFASGSEEGPIAVEGHTVDDVTVAVYYLYRLAFSHIPYENLIV